MASLALGSATQMECVAGAFRTAMRNVASTVTLIAVEYVGQRYGMIATAMMSVSLEPPALAICINRSASIHEPIRRRGVFSVNVLAETQHRISQHFTRSKLEDRFNCGNFF